MFKFLKKKNKKKIKKQLTQEQKEARKWAVILKNVAAYDGSGKGQEDI